MQKIPNIMLLWTSKKALNVPETKLTWFLEVMKYEPHALFRVIHYVAHMGFYVHRAVDVGCSSMPLYLWKCLSIRWFVDIIGFRVDCIQMVSMKYVNDNFGGGWEHRSNVQLKISPSQIFWTRFSGWPTRNHRMRLLHSYVISYVLWTVNTVPVQYVHLHNAERKQRGCGILVSIYVCAQQHWIYLTLLTHWKKSPNARLTLSQFCKWQIPM